MEVYKEFLFDGGTAVKPNERVSEQLNKTFISVLKAIEEKSKKEPIDELGISALARTLEALSSAARPTEL